MKTIRRYRSHSAILIAFCLLVDVDAKELPELSIGDTLQEAAFNTGQMPPEQALVKKYGTGMMFHSNGGSYHVYYLRDLHLWLRCKGDAEDKTYTPISEIMVSGIDLLTRIQPSSVLTNPNLKGIRIGDHLEKALSQWGEPLRKYNKRIGKKQTTVYEYFPDTLLEGSCLRFFVRDRTIVAFSFSSEE